MIEMFEQQGFVVERVEGINSIRNRWDTDPLAPRRGAKRALARALGDRQFCQFVIVARQA
jgi:hypothetical protein